MQTLSSSTAQEMAERLATLEDTFENYSDGIAIIDGNGIFVMGNARYSELFFDKGKEPRPGETAIDVVRRIVEGGRVFGIDQMDPDQAVLHMLIDCYSFVQGSEFALKDGRVIQVSSSPTKQGGHLMTFRDTGRDRVGERRAAELLSDGFSSANIGMVLWDAALTVQLFNPAWSEMTAFPLKIGDSIADLFTHFVQTGTLALPSGVPVEDFVQERITAMHRKPVHVMLDLDDGRRIKLSTFVIASGGVMATAVDVSVQRDAEERARALLRDAVEALKIGVLHLDGDMNLLMMNAAAREIVFAGTARPEPGTHVKRIIFDLIEAGEIVLPDGDSQTELTQNFVDNIRDYRNGLRPLWKDDRTLEFSIDPTEMGGYLISVLDMTDAVNADRAAREADELVRTIVDASPTTFLVSKVDSGEIVFATRASRERFGKIKSTLSFFLDPSDRETYLEALLPTGSLTDYPVKFRREDGSVMDGLTSARVIEYQGEKMIVSSTRDITDFLAMQRELEVQRTQALQNEKLSALGELLAGVAHELSNPLSVVVGYSMMLREEILDDPFAQKLDRIATAANRCVRIVKMFLALAREKPAVLETCEIDRLIEMAISVSDGPLVASGGKLHLDLQDDLPTALADPDHITQVFSNLIINAGQAVSCKGSDGRIDVRAYRSEDANSVVVEVRDNGPGVPKDIRHRVFEPFFTTKDVGSGTGVGLAFSNRVINAHDGSLTLENCEDGGALFRVTLPVHDPRTSKNTVAQSENDQSTAGKRILVVDDEENLSQMLSDIFANAGFLVAQAAGGNEALQLCKDCNFDVIITDMRMPDMDGKAFFDALTHRYPDLAKRMIFLTGDNMNADVSAFISRTGRPHLEKPIAPEDILIQVKQFMSGEPL